MKHSLDKRRRPKRRPVAFESLEPRLLLSADLAPALAPFAHDALPPIPAEHRSFEAMAELPQVVMAQEAARASELVFVDSTLPDYQRLVDDVLRATGGERPVEVILLDPSRDGVAQITEALAGRTGLAAVHLVTHGGDGRLQLGDATLDAAALATHSDAIADWSRAFAADGDLLLYGCNVAETARGGAFIDALALLTGTDVAASDDFTGASFLGGDWVLERTTGVIEGTMLPLTDAAWGGLLATETLDWDAVLVSGTNPYPVAPASVLAWTSDAFGGGNISFSLSGDTGKITTGPVVDQFNEGGTAPVQNALHLSLDLDNNLQQVVWTIDFSHPTGVSNVRFTIFDIDVGGFVDSVTATSNQGHPVITGSVNNSVSGNTVTGGTNTSQTGTDSNKANANFVFGQSGITQITITYKHDAATDPSGQGISLHDITFDVPDVFAANDTGSVAENAVLNVSVAGVLANDVDNYPNTAAAATPLLNYDAAIDPNALATVWADQTAVAGMDWTFSAAPTLNATPVTRFPGIDASYSFPAGGAGATTTTFDAYSGADASFELWFKPSDLADKDALFETGGSANNGLSLLLDGSQLVFYVETDNSTSATASVNLSTLLGAAATADFIQVVGVYDQTGANGQITLYVNGVQQAASASVANLIDWSSVNGAGLGDKSGSASTPGGGAPGAFEGEISRFRFYNTALSATQVRDNYNAVAQALSVAAVQGTAVLPGPTGTTVALASGALVTMRADGSYAYNPNGAFNYLTAGATVTDTFNYTITDSAAPTAHTASATVTITINGLNAAPSIGGLGTLAYTENAAATVIASSATVADVDSADFNGGSLTVSLVANGTASDQLAIRNEGTGAGQIGVSGANVTFGGVTIGTFAGGANGTNLVVTFNASATPAAAQALARNITFANTSNIPSTAARTVSFTVTDGDGGSASANATVNVAAVNDAPTIAAPASIAVTEDVGSALTGISFADVDAGSSDVTVTLTVPSGTLAATSSGGVTVGGTPTALTLTGSVANINSFIAASTVTFATALNSTAAVTLGVTIDDGGNTGVDPGASGTASSEAASTTVTLNVTAFNDAPTITAPASIGVTEDVASALTGISFADVDAGSSNVTVTLSVPSGTLAATSGGGVTVGGTSTALTFTGSVADINSFISASNLTFTTPLNATASVTLTVAIDDGGNTGTDPGTSGTATSEAASATATLSVTAVNDAPVLAGANSLSGIGEDPAGNAGTAVSTLLAGQVTDVDAGALYGIAVTAVDNTNGAWEYSIDGGASWNAFVAPDPATARLLRDTDRVRFVPNADWNGTATISFRAWDRTSGMAGDPGDTTTNGGATAFSAAVQTASITVTAVVDIANDAALTNEDTAVTVNVLANDSFEGATPLVSAVGLAANGSVAIVANQVLYTPNADFNGTDAFTYTVSSGGVVETATVNVTVTAVVDIANDAALTNEDTAVTVNVLANDSFEGATPLVSAVGLAANGSVAIVANQVLYTPNADFNGTDAFTYTVSSGGVVETATVNVTVTAVVDIANDAALTNEDTAVTVNVLANDSFEGATPLVSAVGLAANGSVAIVANQVLYTPNADFNGTDAFTYTVSSGGVVETATVNVTVTAVNDAPTHVAPAANAVTEDVASALTGIAFADIDAGANPVTATFTLPQGTLAATSGGGVVVGGTATALTITGALANVNAFIAGGGLTYTTALDAVTPVTLGVSVNDLGNTGLGGPLASAQTNVTLIVNAVNDAPVNTTPVAATVTEDVPGAITGISVSDVDAGAGNVQVTLAAPAGTFAATAGGGVAVAGSGTGTITLTGTTAAINAFIGASNLTYTTALDAATPVSVTMTTSDLGNSGAGGTLLDTDTFTVNVNAVNDAPTIAAPPVMTVIEDVASPVTGIVIDDVDGTAGPVSVTLSVPSGALATTSGAGVVVAGSGTGVLALVGTTTAINAFIAAGSVTFTTALDATAPVPLSAFVNDLGNFGAGGPLLSPTIGITLNVTAVNDAPVLGPVALSIDPLQTVTMASGNMSATDVDNPAASLVFLVAGATNGQFELAAAPGVPVTSFTQAQLASGAVRFVHTNAGFGPSFSIFVTDGAAVTGPGVAVVSFRAPGGDPPAPAKQPEPVRAPVEAASDVLAIGRSGLSDPTASDFIRAPFASSDTPAVTFAEAPPEAAIVLARPVRAAALLDLRTGGAPGGGFVEAERIPTGLPRMDFAISAVRHDDTTPPLDIAFGSARITGMALSVGAVWWAARAGGLLASLLASTPAWRHVDPLPVLGRDDDEPEIDWNTPEKNPPEEDASEAAVFDEGRAASDLR